MKKKPLTTVRIAYNNLSGKPARAAALVTVVVIMSFALFGGAIISQSLDNGINSLEARLGADIAVLPLGSEADYENIILAGSPVNFYFDSNLERQVAGVAGVERITTQFYLATLENSSCCTQSIQIVGIDYDTDFVVTPWIANFLQRQIGDGEVIVGSDVVIESDNTVMFFDSVLNVAARLDRTATGMDSTVYVSMDTARRIAKTAQEGGHIPGDLEIDSAASSVLVSVAPGCDITEIASGIRKNTPGVDIVESYGIYSSIAKNLRFFTGMINSITVVSGILAVLILAVLFSLIANGRKKEFAVLRILGAKRKKLADIVLTESLFISLCGAALGILFAAMAVFPFGRYIGIQMGMPLLLPGALDSMRLLLFALFLSAAVGPISSAYSAFNISRAETYATMRDGE
ncbi:MAG: FtsX-like permease family protein [Treponema sp.]|nr:FtsX-like permease family protein [Treponema sp.]